MHGQQNLVDRLRDVETLVVEQQERLDWLQVAVPH